MNVDCPSTSIIVCREPIGLSSEMPQPNQTPTELPKHSREYFLAREQAEQAAAVRAKSTKASKIHQELAEEYGRLAR